MNNRHIDDPKQIEKFFKGSPELQQAVMDAFRKAGAKIAVTGGYFSYGMSDSWPRVIPPNENHVLGFDKNAWSMVNSRYMRLVPKQTISCASTPLGEH